MNAALGNMAKRMKAVGTADLSGDENDNAIKKGMVKVHFTYIVCYINVLQIVYTSVGMTGKAKVLASAMQPLAQAMALHSVCIRYQPHSQLAP